MPVITWVYRLILLLVIILTVVCLWEEKEIKKKLNNAFVLIPLLLRLFMLK